jgi:hypothetical protein
MSARWRLYFPRVELRWGVAALLAFAVQFVVTDFPGLPEDARRAVLVASYLLLLAFAAVNLRRPGIAVIALGALLNFSAIVANGGLMPTTPETLQRTNYQVDTTPGHWIPKTKDVLLEREDVHLWFLGDRLVIDGLPRFRAFSIGDVIILAGLVMTVGDLLLPRFGRPPEPRSGKLDLPGAA